MRVSVRAPEPHFPRRVRDKGKFTARFAEFRLRPFVECVRLTQVLARAQDVHRARPFFAADRDCDDESLVVIRAQLVDDAVGGGRFEPRLRGFL